MLIMCNLRTNLLSSSLIAARGSEQTTLLYVNNNIDHGTHQMNKKIPNSSDDKKLLCRTNINYYMKQLGLKLTKFYLQDRQWTLPYMRAADEHTCSIINIF